MPEEQIRDETDGDPNTRYEDTEPQVRTGFIIEEGLRTRNSQTTETIDDSSSSE